MNLNGSHIDVKSYSYFEQEGDKQYSIENKLLEDEVWNIIRLDYTSLPTGNIKLFLGCFSRNNHSELKSVHAHATLIEHEDTLAYTNFET